MRIMYKKIVDRYAKKTFIEVLHQLVWSLKKVEDKNDDGTFGVWCDFVRKLTD